MNASTMQRILQAAFSLALGFFATLFAIVLIVKITPSVLSLDARDPIELQRQLRVLQAVQSNLDSEFEWDRHDNRVCIAGKPTSLFCMLANASISTIGHYQHNSDAMRAVRNVIDARHPDRWTVHPIMDFNNHDDTRRSDLRTVVEESILRLSSQIDETS